MKTAQEALTEFQVMVNDLIDKYVGQYHEENPEERTDETAKQFLEKHNRQFRGEMAQYGTDVFHKAITDDLPIR